MTAQVAFNVLRRGAQSFTLPYRRLAVGAGLDRSSASDLAEAPQKALLPCSKVNVAPLPNPLPIRWGEGKDQGAGHVRSSGIAHRKSSIPSPHPMGRGLGRGAPQLSATAFFRRRRAPDWLRRGRVKLCVTGKAIRAGKGSARSDDASGTHT